LRYVHNLILAAFVGPRPKGMQACHNDGDTTNNRLGNLRWDTPKANMRDRDDHGRTARGERAHRAKLNPEKVRTIRARHARGGVTMAALAREYGVTFNAIRCIVNRQSWKHVS
jgi:hypothetical protein